MMVIRSKKARNKKDKGFKKKYKEAFMSSICDISFDNLYIIHFERTLNNYYVKF